MMVVRDINFPKNQITNEYKVKATLDDDFILFQKNKKLEIKQKIFWSEYHILFKIKLRFY